MANHKQPTKEELEARALKASEEAEALKALGKGGRKLRRQIRVTHY